MFRCLCLPKEEASCLPGTVVALIMGWASFSLLKELFDNGFISVISDSGNIQFRFFSKCIIVCLLRNYCHNSISKGGQADTCLHLLYSVCFYFLVRNFTLCISFGCIYSNIYLFVNGLNVTYITEMFPVLYAFHSCFTWPLLLHITLLQPSCKDGNKVCAWQNKVEWNPYIDAFCHFYVHHSLPSDVVLSIVI